MVSTIKREVCDDEKDVPRGQKTHQNASMIDSIDAVGSSYININIFDAK